ncbi:MAG: hypothetical protein GY953_31285, partial [bacterium]|nr:hypothetical protein [bacterium]
MSSLLELFTEQANSRQVDEQPGVEYEDVPYTFINPETNLPVEMTRRQPVQQRAPQPVDDLTDSTTLFDYGKSIMSGGAGVVSGIGWLMKQLGDEDWGEEGDYTTRFGKAIQDMGTNAVDYWNESLSDAAKTELAKEFVTKDENGEWQWGDASAATVGLFGAQSLLGTAAGMGAGAGITKTLQMFGNPIARGALVSTMQAGRATGATKAAIKAGEAAAKKLKMVDRVLGAAGFGAGEGTIGGIMTGVNVEEQVRNLPLEKLMQSPRFQEIYDSGDQLLSHEQRVEYARDTLAKESSSVAGFQAGTTTALLGAPMGAFFAPLFSRAGIKAINRGAATAIGAGGEAAQEFAQSGVEQLLTNKALIEAGDKRDLWDDVLNAAVGGAAAGGLMGGTFGFAGGADASARQQTKAKKKATANISHLQKITEEARDAGVDPEQVAPILDAAMKPGGMIPALRQMRQLIEEQQEEVPDLETAMEDVEAARPKPKAKRKRKTPKPEVPTLEVEKEEDEVTMPLAAEPQKAPEVETADDVAAQAHEAATSPENNLPEPTEAQKEYGNYKKGKVKLPHLPSILIENPDGSERKGKSADGTEWSRTMKGVHYGYFPRTEGADNEVDGTPTEGVDVMVNAAEGASKTDRPVFVIDQKNKDGSFDEHKVMVGFANGEAAVRAYKAQYDKDWDGIGAITPMGAEEFKAWLKDPENTTKPAAQPESTEAVPEPTPESVPQDQFTNYQDWINERSAEQLAEAPGVLQQIRIDERLEDGQSQQLEALWKEKTT